MGKVFSSALTFDGDSGIPVINIVIANIDAISIDNNRFVLRLLTAIFIWVFSAYDSMS